MFSLFVFSETASTLCGRPFSSTEPPIAARNQAVQAMRPSDACRLGSRVSPSGCLENWGVLLSTYPLGCLSPRASSRRT